MRFVTPVLLFVSLATLESGPAAASAPDGGQKDVTITVVEDPDQLSEKVNTISLPAADEDTHKAAKPGKESGQSKPAEHDKPAEHGQEAESAHESPQSDADQATGDAKQDKNEAQQ